MCMPITWNYLLWSYYNVFGYKFASATNKCEYKYLEKYNSGYNSDSIKYSSEYFKSYELKKCILIYEF